MIHGTWPCSSSFGGMSGGTNEPLRGPTSSMAGSLPFSFPEEDPASAIQFVCIWMGWLEWNTQSHGPLFIYKAGRIAWNWSKINMRMRTNLSLYYIWCDMITNNVVGTTTTTVVQKHNGRNTSTVNRRSTCWQYYGSPPSALIRAFKFSISTCWSVISTLASTGNGSSHHLKNPHCKLPCNILDWGK